MEKLSLWVMKMNIISEEKMDIWSLDDAFTRTQHHLRSTVTGNT